MAASDAHPARHPFPGATGYRTRLSGDKLAGHRAGEGLPSSRRHYLYVPRPIRRRVLDGCDFRFFTASIGLRRAFSGSAPSVPTLTGRLLTALQASLHAADRPVAHPPRGLNTPLRRRPLDRRRELRYRGPWCLPGPDFHRQAALSLASDYTPVSFLSEALGLLDVRLDPPSRLPL